MFPLFSSKSYWKQNKSQTRDKVIEKKKSPMKFTTEILPINGQILIICWHQFLLGKGQGPRLPWCKNLISFAKIKSHIISIKEVIIETPDYTNDAVILEELHNEARLYKKANKLKRLPSINKIFFNEKDNTLDSFNEKLENLIEEMGNSKNRKVIIHLNEFPILAPHATTSPFKRRWLNILSIVIFPIGILIYLRALKFRIRLVKDLVKIESNTKNLINILKKEKLI